MCEPTTMVMAIGAMTAGMAAASAMQPGAIQGAKPTTPAKPPQASKAPNAAGMRRDNGAAGGINAGQASTMLTGTAGVDPSKLTLGKNTLLGM